MFDHIWAFSSSNTWWNAKFIYLTITYVWPCIWVWSYKIWPCIWLWAYIGNNFDHIFEFDHISDSSLTMYLSLPILSVLECHTMACRMLMRTLPMLSLPFLRHKKPVPPISWLRQQTNLIPIDHYLKTNYCNYSTCNNTTKIYNYIFFCY